MVATASILLTTSGSMFAETLRAASPLTSSGTQPPKATNIDTLASVM